MIRSAGQATDLTPVRSIFDIEGACFSKPLLFQNVSFHVWPRSSTLGHSVTVFPFMVYCLLHTSPLKSRMTSTASSCFHSHFPTHVHIPLWVNNLWSHHKRGNTNLQTYNVSALTSRQCSLPSWLSLTWRTSVFSSVLSIHCTKQKIGLWLHFKNPLFHKKRYSCIVSYLIMTDLVLHTVLHGQKLSFV